MPKLETICQSMNSETLSLITDVRKFSFLKKTFIILWNVWKNIAATCNQINKKIPTFCNAKEYYQSFIRKKHTKSVKQSEIITYQPKSFENPNIADIKLVIMEHP